MRDKLAAYLWPESDEERARRSLSDSIYRINKALGESTIVTLGDEVQLDSDRLPSDVTAFRDAIDQRDWARAADLYAGPLLDGFHLPGADDFERWIDAERARLARRHAEALEALAEELAAGGDVAASADAWQRRAAHDPYDSRVAVRLMEAMEAAGNRAGALKHARVHTQLLANEFGTGPDPAVLALAERLRTLPGTDVRTGTTPIGESTDSPSETAPSSTPVSGHRGGTDHHPPTGGRAAGLPVASDPPPRPSVPARASPTHRAGRGLAAGILLAVASLAGIGGWLVWGRAAGPGDAPTPTIAVLPFENLDSDEESLFFADGVTEDVLTSLSRIRDLRVTAPASVMPYRTSDRSEARIAEELGVRYLLRGSVRRADDDVRITARLVDTRTNASIWGEAYDRRMEDVFAVQSDIARRVADALEAELTPRVAAEIDRRPTDDLIAYNLYLRGRYFWHRRTEEALRQSAELFEQAVERDPNYARAWAGLADAYAVLAFYDYLPPGEAYPNAKSAARHALAIDETLAEAHASLGYITLYHDWDATRAETEFRRAIELNPSYSVGHQWYANLLVATGRFEEADREMSRAREVNPLSVIANLALGWVYYYAGRNEDAVRQCDRALEMDPELDLAYLWRGLALEELGRADDARASLERAVELSGGSGITVAALAHAHAGAGEPERARRLLRGLVDATAEGRYQPSFEIAKAHVALGEPDEAIRWLERAFHERSHSMVFLDVDPQLAPLRGDPDFRRLVERVGLKESP